MLLKTISICFAPLETQQTDGKWEELEPNLRKVVEEFSDKTAVELNEDDNDEVGGHSELEAERCVFFSVLVSRPAFAVCFDCYHLRTDF